MEPLELLPIPLLQWYRENARVLPWRSDPTPYHVWLSEIMLQQTRVAAVLDYYRRFLAQLPDVAALAAVEDTLPECLTVTARTQDGEVMAVQYRDRPVYGLQFHPESILTPEGRQIVKNFLEG